MKDKAEWLEYAVISTERDPDNDDDIPYTNENGWLKWK
jgi:hypothetical protein